MENVLKKTWRPYILYNGKLDKNYDSRKFKIKLFQKKLLNNLVKKPLNNYNYNI